MAKTKDSNRKLMVVEDEPILLKALNIELLGSGYNVLSAVDGEEALSIIRDQKPDIVLLDLMLPKMNGFQVLEELKKDESTKNIPVVILSNLGAEEHKQKALDLGAAGYYVKSDTDLGDLVQLIQSTLA